MSESVTLFQTTDTKAKQAIDQVQVNTDDTQPEEELPKPVVVVEKEDSVGEEEPIQEALLNNMSILKSHEKI